MAMTRWVKQGIPEKAIMTISGHKTRKVFDRYTNLSDSDLQDMLRMVEVRRQRDMLQQPKEGASS